MSITMTKTSHSILPALLCAALAGCAGSDGGGQSTPPDTTIDRAAPLVEEPDLYQRDGELLFVQNPATGLNVISLADAARPRLVGRADTVGGKGGQLFLLPDRVAVVLLKTATAACRPLAGLASKGFANATEVDVVDVATPAAPVILGRHCIPGALVDARMVDNGAKNLYMVTTATEIGDTGSRAIALRFANPKVPALGADVSFPGDGKNILVNRDALIVASVSPFDARLTRVQYFETAIDGNLLPRGFFDVPGEPQGRFHMDLSGRWFRIVTFDSLNQTSRLTILDTSDPDHLKEAGALAPIGAGRLYATRFDGDRAYVITFRRVDPLYVISLKEPAKPTILGELSIPDWSDFLYPRGNRLIGVGRSASGAFVGLTLFDVTDPTKPKGIDQIQFKTNEISSSEANVDYRGLLIVDDPNQPWVALPYSTVKFTKDQARDLCTVDSFLQVVDIGPLGFVKRGKARQLGPVVRSFLGGANNDRLVSISDYEIKSLDAIDRDGLQAGETLTVGTAAGLQETVRDTCNDARDRWHHFLYACSVGAKDPGRNNGLEVLVAGAILLARRRNRPAR